MSRKSISTHKLSASETFPVLLLYLRAARPRGAGPAAGRRAPRKKSRFNSRLSKTETSSACCEPVAHRLFLFINIQTWRYDVCDLFPSAERQQPLLNTRHATSELYLHLTYKRLLFAARRAVVLEGDPLSVLFVGALHLQLNPLFFIVVESPELRNKLRKNEYLFIV